MAPARISAEYTEDSRPIEMPDRIVVAGPVTVASAISCTGLYFVSVKYCGQHLDHRGEHEADRARRSAGL